MNPSPGPPPRQGRSPLFWVAVAAGGLCFVCGAGTLAVVALGSLAGGVAAEGAEASGGGAAGWLPAGEKTRSTGLTQPLPGGRWLYMNGSGMETVLARTSTTETVKQEASGALYEFTFESDGTYLLRWRHASNFMTYNTSSTDERGAWTLDGTTLTLTPESQKARYTNSGLAQDKEDVDLAPRRYRVVDIELETITTAGVDYRTFPGIELEGPVPAWDLASGSLSLDLQRLR
ncbi:MAG: hypothetical protein AB1938_13755 [Myxococcota bacterium]